MNLSEFLEEMKAKYGDSIVVKLNDGENAIPASLPKPLQKLYKIYNSIELPFGEIYPLQVTLKEDEPFKSEGWLCFGFDGYFTYWLCKKELDDTGEAFTAWDHETDDEIEATHSDLVEFLTDIETEYEPESCKVVLVQQVTDKKLALRIKKDFSSPFSISEFIKSCNTAPFVIRDDLSYKTAVQIISDNKEYNDLIKVEFI
jgi:hypothetical protein